MLLKRGADVNLSDHEGLSPLHVAALENYDYLISVLIDSGAELDVKDVFGYTPLHLAADQGSFNAAQNLVFAGANVNNRSEWGGTPLHASVAKKNFDLIASEIPESQEQLNSANKIFPLDSAKSLNIVSNNINQILINKEDWIDFDPNSVTYNLAKYVCDLSK